MFRPLAGRITGLRADISDGSDLAAACKTRSALHSETVADIHTDVARQPYDFSDLDVTEICAHTAAHADHTAVGNVRNAVRGILATAVGGRQTAVPAPKDTLNQSNTVEKKAFILDSVRLGLPSRTHSVSAVRLDCPGNVRGGRRPAERTEHVSSFVVRRGALTCRREICCFHHSSLTSDFILRNSRFDFGENKLFQIVGNLIDVRDRCPGIAFSEYSIAFRCAFACASASNSPDS